MFLWCVLSQHYFQILFLDIKFYIFVKEKVQRWKKRIMLLQEDDSMISWHTFLVLKVHWEILGPKNDFFVQILLFCTLTITFFIPPWFVVYFHCILWNFIPKVQWNHWLPPAENLNLRVEIPAVMSLYFTLWACSTGYLQLSLPMWLQNCLE